MKIKIIIIIICSVMLLRQLVLHLASLPNPTHAPVWSFSLLLAKAERRSVVSKQQKTIPVFLCGRCPVPAPAGSAVDLWQPGKTDSHHPSTSRRTDQLGSWVWRKRWISSSQEDLLLYSCAHYCRFQRNPELNSWLVSIVFCLISLPWFIPRQKYNTI